jgi:hypothetical protein
VVSPEGAIGGVRPDHRHISDPVANLKAAHAFAQLIDFANDVIPQHEGWPATHRLRVEVAPNQHVGVFQTRGEHADPHLAPAGRRQGHIDHLQRVGTAEVPDLNNPIALLSHGRVPAVLGTGRKARHRTCPLFSLSRRLRA